MLLSLIPPSYNKLDGFRGNPGITAGLLQTTAPYSKKMSNASKGLSRVRQVATYCNTFESSREDRVLIFRLDPIRSSECQAAKDRQGLQLYERRLTSSMHAGHFS